MLETTKCPDCGSEMLVRPLQGQCPTCLLQLALQPGLVDELPLDEIGDYQLVRKIGEGGCGVVYLTQQRRPVRRVVALKIIKLGMDTREVIHRFAAEQRAMALMDHPNIAKVLDAGATDAGRPFFVMELVEGLKITDFCDQRSLSIAERLGLFITVCEAVQHAHQKGVIHRDLKPANILVTKVNGEPVAKVIDFGIAKATTGQRLFDQTVFTAFEQFLGTPAYMSPEQAGLGRLDIDTRSDIYSLGVLLYELLSSRTPFDSEELQSAPLDCVLAIVREKEPPRPSARFEALSGEQRSAVARRRRYEPSTLQRQLRGDLDWIVMKALEKDRTRRYETANGLALDVRRYLDSEPVSARPPSNIYRLKKLVRRNRLAFGAASIVLATLVAGIAFSSWQAWRATHAEREQTRLRREAQLDERRALIESAKSQQVAQFLGDMIQGVGPSVAQGRDTTVLQEILNKTADRVGTELANQPEVEVEMCNTLARSYLALGLWYRASDLATQAGTVAKASLSRTNAQSIEALRVLATAQRELGQWTAAERTARETLEAVTNASRGDNLTVAACLEALGWIQVRSGAVSEETLELFHRSLAMREHLSGETNHGYVSALDGEAWALSGLGRHSEAIAIDQRVLSIGRTIFTDQSFDMATLLNAYGAALETANQPAEAEKVFREALAIYEKLEGRNHPGASKVIHNLTRTLAKEGRESEAEGLYRGEIEREAKTLGRQSQAVTDNLSGLALLLREAGKFVEADEVYGEFIEAVRLRQPPDLRTLTDGLATLLHNMPYAKTYAKNEHYAREYVAIKEKQGNGLDYAWFLAHKDLGNCLLGEKKYAEAEPVLVSNYTGLKGRVLESAKMQICTHETLDSLIQLYQETGRQDQLARWKLDREDLLRGEVAQLQTNTGADPYFKVRALTSLAEALFDLQKFEDSERTANQCLALCQEKLAGKPGFYCAQCLVGRNLYQRRRLLEAEKLLTSGCEGLRKENVQDIGPETQQILRESMSTLVQLYSSKGQSAQASRWQRSLAE